MRAALAWALETGRAGLGLELVVGARELLGHDAARRGHRSGRAMLLDERSRPMPSRPDGRARSGFREAWRTCSGTRRARPASLRAERWPWLGSSATSSGVGDPPAPACDHWLRRGRHGARAGARRSRASPAIRSVGAFREGRGAGARRRWREVGQANGDLEGALELLEEARRLAHDVRLPLVAGGHLGANRRRCLLELGAARRCASVNARAGPGSVQRDARPERHRLRARVCSPRSPHGPETRERAGTLLGRGRGRGRRRRRSAAGSHGLVRCQPSLPARHAEFEDGLEDGRALSLDDAVALALDGYLTRSIGLERRPG